GPLAVGQYLVGGGYVNISSTLGDPAFGVVLPVEQHRSSFDFVAPSTFTRNLVTVLSPLNNTFTLDGQPIGGSLSAIGNSGFGYLHLDATAGAHHLEGGAAFAITV